MAIVAVVSARKQNLQGRLEKLLEDYEAASKSLGFLIDPVERERTRRRLADLTDEMESIESEVQKLEIGDASSGRRQLRIRDLLPRIDFKSVDKVVDKFLRRAGRNSHGAILLVEKSHRLGGDQCAVRIKDRLSQATADLKHWKVNLSLTGGRPDEHGLLAKLGEYLNVNRAGLSHDEFLQAVVGALCNSLQSGSIAFLDLRKWDNFHPPRDVLKWFIDRFWKAVLATLESSPQNRVKMRVLALLVVDHELCAECRADIEGGDVVLVPLRLWKKVEIRDWLESYSGLEAIAIDQLAEKVFGATGGRPVEVCSMLHQELENAE